MIGSRGLSMERAAHSTLTSRGRPTSAPREAIALACFLVFSTTALAAKGDDAVFIGTGVAFPSDTRAIEENPGALAGASPGLELGGLYSPYLNTVDLGSSLAFGAGFFGFGAGAGYLPLSKGIEARLGAAARLLGVIGTGTTLTYSRSTGTRTIDLDSGFTFGEFSGFALGVASRHVLSQTREIVAGAGFRADALQAEMDLAYPMKSKLIRLVPGAALTLGSRFTAAARYDFPLGQPTRGNWRAEAGLRYATVGFAAAFESAFLRFSGALRLFF